MYRIWARLEKFEGRDAGRYRVVAMNAPIRSKRNIMVLNYVKSTGSFGIMSTKPYPIGSIINPTKELNRVLKARRAA